MSRSATASETDKRYWPDDGDAPEATLVFIHGVGLDNRIWGTAKSDLTAYSTLFYELPGHGSRAEPVHLDDLDTYVDDLRDALDSFGIEQAVFIGAAFGEFIARRFAFRFAERTSAVVLLSPLWRRSQPAIDRISGRVEAIDAQGVASSLSASLDRWLSPAARQAHPEREALVRDMMERTPHSSFMSAYRVYATADIALSQEAHSINCPALLIAGEDDGNATPEMAERLAAAMTQAVVVALPGVRHLISLDAPGPFAECLDGFLQQLKVKVN